MARKRDKSSEIKEALQGKKLPILTLDERWYQLLPEHEKTTHIKQLETELNNLLKKQGQMINDIKDMKKLKKKLMSEIVANMEPDSSPAGRIRAKKLEKSHQFIEELNYKMQNADEVLLDMPYEIKKVNEELLVESMRVCYKRLKRNKKEIEESDKWIKETREALKKRIISKQEKELENSSLYTYMHDILGNTVLDSLDENE